MEGIGKMPSQSKYQSTRAAKYPLLHPSPEWTTAGCEALPQREASRVTTSVAQLSRPEWSRMTSTRSQLSA